MVLGLSGCYFEEQNRHFLFINKFYIHLLFIFQYLIFINMRNIYIYDILACLIKLSIIKLLQLHNVVFAEMLNVYVT